MLSNMIERAMIYNYIILTTQMVLMLEDITEGKKLTEQQEKQQSEVLKEGASLLSLIVNGAMLVEGRKFENDLRPTMEGLWIYGYALMTMSKLDLAEEIENFTEFFEKLSIEIYKLIQYQKKDEINVPLLKKFFIALNSSLRARI